MKDSVEVFSVCKFREGHRYGHLCEWYCNFTYDYGVVAKGFLVEGRSRRRSMTATTPTSVDFPLEFTLTYSVKIILTKRTFSLHVPSPPTPAERTISFLRIVL